MYATEGTQAGLSAFDAGDYARRIEREFHCRVKFVWTLPMREGTRTAFDVRICATGAGASAAGHTWERGYSLPWPTGQCRTISGLLFRLCVELDKLLSEEKRAAERATNGRLPGF